MYPESSLECTSLSTIMSSVSVEIISIYYEADEKSELELID